jgi:hypothetical protein
VKFSYAHAGTNQRCRFQDRLIVVGVLRGLAGQFFIASRPSAHLEEFGRVLIYLLAIVNLWLLLAYADAGLRSRT